MKKVKYPNLNDYDLSALRGDQGNAAGIGYFLARRK